MELIEIEPHFWELYQQDEQLFLSIAIDLSSVVSCWDIILSNEDTLNYQMQGRDAIQALAEQLVAQIYRGDSTRLEQCKVSPQQQQMMHETFKVWQQQKAQP
ncbi:hypothetical protein N5J44_14045 [Acinetobacter ursingii]|uniref:hypothetical protein n=1 Tax=Acinetobacter ursingii TaxID=108980 RepID=UPI0024481C47|nr:hypothetical protein [Acinetobacter ursingii]MDH2020330.1 hypothetical protein [Acinetobacter ursingii]MDH2072649.1 hypothetical protein [Acinetobacter ursingii]